MGLAYLQLFQSSWHFAAEFRFDHFSRFADVLGLVILKTPPNVFHQLGQQTHAVKVRALAQLHAASKTQQRLRKTDLRLRHFQHIVNGESAFHCFQSNHIVEPATERVLFHYMWQLNDGKHRRSQKKELSRTQLCLSWTRRELRPPQPANNRHDS